MGEHHAGKGFFDGLLHVYVDGPALRHVEDDNDTTDAEEGVEDGRDWFTHLGNNGTDESSELCKAKGTLEYST